MTEDKSKPPFDPFKMESLQPGRNKDVTIPMPNRELRRKMKKPKFRHKVEAHMGKPLPQETESQVVDEDTKAKLLENLDVQKFLGVLNGLLTGQKKLVIESTPELVQRYDEARDTSTSIPQYTHTFRVEDC